METHSTISKVDRFVVWLSKHWLLVVNSFLAILVITPLLAPLFMKLGWNIPGKTIYWVYSFLCHQLPERSYFLFGPKISYSLSEIQITWPFSNDATVLRQFIGNESFGWKIAWSDRMVSMFTSSWIFAILWSLLKSKVKPLPFWGLLILFLPLVVDGTTHLISDFAGLGLGFRDTNSWLLFLTNNSISPSFYSGDAWGSFNAWMRLLTGVLFGFGTVWYAFPLLNEMFINFGEEIKSKQKYRTLYLDKKLRLLQLYSEAKQEDVNSNNMCE
jgi:uncharacterized membrane protein